MSDTVPILLLQSEFSFVTVPDRLGLNHVLLPVIRNKIILFLNFNMPISLW